MYYKFFYLFSFFGNHIVQQASTLSVTVQYDWGTFPKTSYNSRLIFSHMNKYKVGGFVFGKHRSTTIVTYFCL